MECCKLPEGVYRHVSTEQVSYDAQSLANILYNPTIIRKYLEDNISSTHLLITMLILVNYITNIIIIEIWNLDLLNMFIIYLKIFCMLEPIILMVCLMILYYYVIY